MKSRTAVISTVAAGLGLGAAGLAHAQQAANSGLAPWVLVGNAAAAGETGPWSRAGWTQGVRAGGLAPSFWDRVGLSITRTDAALPLAAFGGSTPTSVLGLKVRVAGDATQGSDTWMPQIAIGLQQRFLHPGSAAPALHLPPSKTSATDFYVSATKLLQAQGVLLNATVRATRMDQTGPLGFGLAVPGRERYSLRPELSVAFLLSRNLAIGAEYRFKPANSDTRRDMGLGYGLRDDDAKDLYIAWAPYKNLSLTLAYVGQDRTVPGLTVNRRPAKSYLSAELSF